MRAMPAASLACLTRPSRGRLRRISPIHRSCAEVRRASVDCPAVGAADGCIRIRDARRCEHVRAGAAPSRADAGTRFQPGRRACETSWPARRTRAVPRATNRIADRPPRRAPARERARRLRTQAARQCKWCGNRAGGRCEHHRCDARCVRTRAARGGGARSPGAYGCASGRSIAAMTSADTAARGRSPSRRVQPEPAACRR